MSKLRTINIDPQFLSMSKKKSKTLKSNIPLNEVKLNSNNIRELLLEKLKQHKKNKKTLKNPMVQLNTMDEQSGNEQSGNEQSGNQQSRNEYSINQQSGNEYSSNNTRMPDINPLHNSLTNTKMDNFDLDKEIKQLEDTPLIQSGSLQNEVQYSIRPDKPYGVLKNGLKPTYKSWSSHENNTMQQMPMQQMSMQPMSMQPMSMQPMSMQPMPMQQMPMQPMPIQQMPIEQVPMIQELEVKKVFQLGRNKKNKTVSVLLKNNSTRKKIEGDKINFKKTNISTVKNFLKRQNLIRFGTTAPNNLLREIYESTKLCGEITNENSKSIIHNFNEA
jgi:hypothetical protein